MPAEAKVRILGGEKKNEILNLPTPRSASECSLESECSDSDTGYKAGGSDTESDVEMEVGGSF